jgi:hypothetical protein
MYCGNKIHAHTALYGTGRCSDCFHKTPHKKDCRCSYCLKKGKDNPNWRGGGKVYYCKNCNKPLRSGKAFRKINTGLCRSCCHKFLIGKNNPSYRLEVRKKISKSKYGSKNPAWQGGISYLPYSYKFTEKLKEKIRERDKFICVGCGKHEESEISNNGRKLTIHHINYNKMDCNKSNLVSVCTSCNIKANANRDYWFAYYTWQLSYQINLTMSTCSAIL